jgi:hypothetical protein
VIRLLLRKFFYDLWDNLVRIALLNLGFIAVFAVPLFVPQLLAWNPLLEAAATFAGALLVCVYLSTIAALIKKIPDAEFSPLAELKSAAKPAIPAGLLSGAVFFFVFIIITVTLPFYLQINSTFGIFFAVVVFWFMCAVLLILQYFIPVKNRLEPNLKKALKKSALLFLDNSLFSVFLLLFSFLLLLVSVFVAFLAPGPAGALLFLDEALRLRLLKYDYLEAHPDANRKKIPWDTLLEAERENVGKRSWKSFIFPWKE